MDILKIVMFETNGAADIPSRPYELDLREGVSGVITELDELTNGGRHINGATISRLASGILVPSTNARHTNIVNGWGERRIIFAMVVAVETLDNYSDIRYISGYTDHADYVIDDRGYVLFPSDMRLYFNSVTKITLNEIPSRGRGGRVIRPTIKDNNLMLRKDSIVNPNARRRPGDNPSLLRPSDLLSRQASNNHVNRMLRNIDSPISINTIGKFNTSTLMSRRANNNSSEHMSHTLSKYIEARSLGEDASSGFITDHDDDDNYMSSASALAREDIFSHDVLYDQLKSMTDIVDSGYVEWGELKRLAPDFDEHRDLPFTTWKAQIKASNRSRRDAFSDDKKYSTGVAKYSEGASFYDTSVESMCALMIAQAIPAVLVNAMYSSVEGLVLNSHPQHGEPHVHMSMAMPFMDGIPIDNGYNYLKSYLTNVVLPNVSKNGALHVEAMVNANIDKDIEVWITIDGGPEEYYPYPVWAESLISPVVTDDERDLEAISQGVAGLMEDFALTVESKNPRNIEIHKSARDIFNAAPKTDRVSPRREREDIYTGDNAPSERTYKRNIVIDL